ncbi:restriction endonuclease [Yinghuangia soli]|uniref:restriction endonuclease n=1 Tax=Yinghuangia soli TaxID=2908204 RepID=UPI0027E3531A|nr:restriction endonuclease [Yinghuangia soli]
MGNAVDSPRSSGRCGRAGRVGRTRRARRAERTWQSEGQRRRWSSRPSPRLARLYGQLTVAFLLAAGIAAFLREWRILTGICALAAAVIVLAVGVTSMRGSLRRAAYREESGRVTHLLADVDLMDGPEFERHVAALCLRDGCTRVGVDGGAGDLCADVTAYLPDGRTLVIQCKRYAEDRSVGSPDMQRFVGTARPVHAADVAVFVASCRFTDPALDLAEDQGIVLVDRDLLSRWMRGTPLTSLVDAAESRFPAEY